MHIRFVILPSVPVSLSRAWKDSVKESREVLGVGQGCWSRERKEGSNLCPPATGTWHLAEHLRRRGDVPVSASLDDLDTFQFST